jgi:hypothetical protein
VSYSIGGNVWQLGEVAEIEAQMFGLVLHFNRCTDVQLTTKPAILPNCCYGLPFQDNALGGLCKTQNKLIWMLF